MSYPSSPTPTALVALTALLFLTACVSPEEQAARLAALDAADRQECTYLGFTPNTDAFGNCMLRLRQIRAQEANTQAIRRAYQFGPPFHHRSFRRYGFPYY